MNHQITANENQVGIATILRHFTVLNPRREPRYNVQDKQESHLVHDLQSALMQTFHQVEFDRGKTIKRDKTTDLRLKQVALHEAINDKDAEHEGYSSK